MTGLFFLYHARYTFHEGVSGIYALKACILSHLHRSNEARDCIMVLEDIHKSVSQMKPGECEILYGRCGYLLSLLFTQTHVGMSSVRKDIVANIAKQVCSQNITFRAKVYKPPYLISYHGKLSLIDPGSSFTTAKASNLQ